MENFLPELCVYFQNLTITDLNWIIPFIIFNIFTAKQHLDLNLSACDFSIIIVAILNTIVIFTNYNKQNEFHSIKIIFILS